MEVAQVSQQQQLLHDELVLQLVPGRHHLLCPWHRLLCPVPPDFKLYSSIRWTIQWSDIVQQLGGKALQEETY